MGGRKSIGAEKQTFERVRWTGCMPRWFGEPCVSTVSSMPRSLLKNPIHVDAVIKEAKFQLDRANVVVSTVARTLSMWRVDNGTQLGKTFQSAVGIVTIEPGFGTSFNLLLEDGSAQQSPIKPSD